MAIQLDQGVAETDRKVFQLDNQTRNIFLNVFAFYGRLDPEGIILELAGNIFKKPHKNPKLLVGQRFSETVFWQSSENTPKILDREIQKAANREPSKILLDFRISSDKKIAVEMFLQPVEEAGKVGHIFFCAQEVSGREDQLEHHKQRSEHLLEAAENAEIGLWFWDLNENKLYSTPTCNELFEVPAYDLLTFESFPGRRPCRGPRAGPAGAAVFAAKRHQIYRRISRGLLGRPYRMDLFRRAFFSR